MLFKLKIFVKVFKSSVNFIWDSELYAGAPTDSAKVKKRKISHFILAYIGGGNSQDI